MNPKNKDLREPVSLYWFLQTTAKYSHILVEVAFVSIVIRLLTLIEPFAFQTLIDRVLPFQRESSLNIIFFLLIGVAIFEAALAAIGVYLSEHTANRVTSRLGKRVFEHMLHIPLLEVQKWQVGELLARAAEIAKVRYFLTNTAIGAVLDVLFALIYFFALYSISPLLTAIVVVVMPIQMGILFIIGPFLRSRLQDSFTAGAQHQSRLVETFGDMENLKSLAGEWRREASINETLENSLVQSLRVAVINNYSDRLLFVVRKSLTAFVLYFGAQLVFANQVTLGQLIAFYLLAERVFVPVMNLANLWEVWQNLKISRLRLGDLLHIPTEIPDILPKIKRIKSSVIEANDITFSYDGQIDVLSSVNFKAQSGCMNLIVGPSGCGKSTLAKIMTGLYQPKKGIIQFNSEDISLFDPFNVRRTIIYVPQQPTLQSGTIRENLTLVSPHASEHDIVDALEKSMASSIIDSFPLGLDTPVGERGSNLSGGQRQRLCIARAILAQPAVLILDEPTSSLDSENQDALVKHLKELSKIITVIIITHKQEIFSGKNNVLNLTP